MIVLGLGGAVGHDPAAALVIDGNVIAAAEEERFLRDKHAKGQQAEQAALYCLKQAQIKPTDVQVVAYPFAPISIFGPERWHYARRHLYAPDMPDPDLLVRTSGEHRISNYLLWQVAYSELHFTDVLWPDFRREHLFGAIEEFQRRERRFGAV